ncbi:hypothetical protein BTVI_119563 [Pitangus sulphuratus]|nr:hypothetical protein BTVI_119563 [Pitangus sulphuratus]
MAGFLSAMPLGMLRLCPHLSGGDSGEGTHNKDSYKPRSSPAVPAGRAKPGVSLRAALANEPSQRPRGFRSRFRLEQRSVSKTFTFNN